MKYKKDCNTRDATDDWLTQLESLYSFSSLVCLLPHMPHYSGNSTQMRVERREVMVVQEQQDQVTNRLIAFLTQVGTFLTHLIFSCFTQLLSNFHDSHN